MSEPRETEVKHVERFEFDLATPFFEQVLRCFDLLGTAPLDQTHLVNLEPSQGVYGLYREATLVYVGKAEDPLPTRLGDHRFKIEGRQNISPAEMRFKAVYLAKTWVPLAPETRLIRHFQAKDLCEWNGNGFGPHDPGRNRERTNKPPEGFDAQYPIKADWPCTAISAGQYEANDLLQRVKSLLPFCFRYETDTPGGGWRRGSTKYNGKQIDVSNPGMPAAELVKLIARTLGPTWQATLFPSYIILYEEREQYKYGVPLT